MRVRTIPAARSMPETRGLALSSSPTSPIGGLNEGSIPFTRLSYWLASAYTNTTLASWRFPNTFSYRVRACPGMFLVRYELTL
jgi:hypothetical protein